MISPLAARLPRALAGLAAMAALAVAARAGAVPTHVELIPNGEAAGCFACHVEEPALNEFGLDFENHAARWGPDLALMDSDGDGASNGEELGDPTGEWERGQPAPGVTPSNPGDAGSTPGGDGGAEDGGCALARRRTGSPARALPCALAALAIGLVRRRRRRRRACRVLVERVRPSRPAN